MEEKNKSFADIIKKILYDIFVKDWAVKLGCLVAAFAVWLVLSSIG